MKTSNNPINTATETLDSEPPASNVLVAEAHHRISNSLQLIASLLRLQGSQLARGEALTPRDAQVLLDDAAARVGTVALLHRLLSRREDDERVAVAGYLGEVCASLAAALSFDGELDMSGLQADSMSIEAERAVPLGTIVSELIINSIKYAHPAGVAGRIAIRGSRVPGGVYRIEIADDGIGLPEGLDPDSSGGLGFQVVRALCSQLDARVRFDSHGLGLSVYLDISV